MVQAYSIGTGKRNDLQKNDNPGPGTYESEKKPQNANPNWKIGAELRPQWGKNENPGPGNYNAKLDFSSKTDRSPSYQIGTRHKSLERDKSPGPGSYNPKINQQNLPHYSIRLKTNYDDKVMQKRQKDPGPGFYETNQSTMYNQPSTKIGRSLRNTFAARSLSPGPGSYQDIKYKTDTPLFRFGNEIRQNANQQNSSSTYKIKNLGPGLYNIKSTLKTNIGPLLTPRRINQLEKANLYVPGPGSYEQKVDLIKKSDPQYKIGTGKMRVVFDTRNNIQIGPGQYSPKFENIKKKSPNCKIGTSKQIDLDVISNTPGAGTYNIPSKIIEGPKYIMNPRRDDSYLRKDIIQNPGPNKYNLNLKLTKEHSSSIGIGSSQRSQMWNNNNSPGPGRYLQVNKSPVEGPVYSFGKENKDQLQNKNQVPGPGTYKLKSTFADVPKYLIPDKTQTIQIKNKSIPTEPII